MSATVEIEIMIRLDPADKNPGAGGIHIHSEKIVDECFYVHGATVDGVMVSAVEALQKAIGRCSDRARNEP